MSEKPSASSPISGENALLANRYVGALLALSEEEKATNAVIDDMLNLREIWNECREWREVANNPRFTTEFIVAAAEQVAKIARTHKLTANFLTIVAQNRRLALLPNLIDMFMDEVSKARGEQRADVCSAHPLTNDQHARLTETLEKATGGKVRLIMTEDPSIIGGLTVKIGSKFVDASVKTKLDRLEHILKETNAAA
ncbi:MAG: ATP synthase F1 subunit delta [Alphaproteobacteria bacterium]|nr:ATP synthase F1 subunit delta [Alphaproteobacteria bacterium]